MICMTAIGNLLGVARTAQVAGLLGHNLQLIKKKKIRTKDIVGTAATNIIGIPLITTQAQLASGL